MTTITIDEGTKEELLKIGAKLQIQEKRKIDYNTTIKFLISNFNKEKNSLKLRKACRIIKNIDINDVLNELYLERKKDKFSF